MPVERLPRDTACNAMKQTNTNPLVMDIMSSDVTTIHEDVGFHDAAKVIMEKQFNHLPVVDSGNHLVGIVTAWDISKAVAKDEHNLVRDIMTRKVVTASPDESVDISAFKLDSNSVSALPVIDSNRHVVGIITSDDISKLLARRH
jgi:CBS domain-containing protein